MTCVACGASLAGKATKYCSRACAKAHYQRADPERQRLANRRSSAKHRDKRRAYAAARRQRVHVRELDRQWRLRNAERVRASEKRRRAKKTAYMRAYNRRPDIMARRRAYNKANRARDAEAYRQYCAANRERMRELMSRHHSRRRSQQLGNGPHEKIDRLVVFSRAGWRCQLCGRQTPRSLIGKRVAAAPTLDHIVPLSKGGAHTYANIQCACWQCNSEKRVNSRGQPGLF